MQKIVKISIFVVLALLILPPVSFAQSDRITEQCCKAKADFIWEGKIAGPGGVESECIQPDGSVDLNNCKILKGQTIGPSKTTKCSLPNKAGTPNADVDKASSGWGLICLVSTVYTVTNWIFFIMMTLAVVLIIIGGIMYMTAGANPDNTTKAKNFITYAIIGLVIALIAKFVPPIAKFILGVQ